MAYSPDAVARLCDEFCNRWPRAEFGPAHIVLNDCNFEDHWLDLILGRMESMPTPLSCEHQETLAFLRRLREIPEAERAYPEDAYDANGHLTG